MEDPQGGAAAAAADHGEPGAGHAEQPGTSVAAQPAAGDYTAVAGIERSDLAAE
ncbi:hypothetical protein [Streptomyces sp. NRRL B-24720]|uniref:hypothetical protein n=1 Tax=Streptomyces sp. NRRL B-24720 TaxID=1476876 RepID=UPI00131DF632|nr:hypothetical protein [Streptomyces sp. NRRL B-24720]